MFNFFKHKWVIGMFLLAALFLSLGFFVVPSFADDVTGSATVNAGTLTMNATDNPAFTAVTLNGTDQTTTDDINIDVNDSTGSGDGWKLQITSTTFASVSNTLSNNATTIQNATSACDAGTCTDPTNGIGYPLTVPADTTPPTAVSFFNAAAGTGMGDFTVTPSLQLSIPANTYAGTYTSTMTISIASGP